MVQKLQSEQTDKQTLNLESITSTVLEGFWADVMSQGLLGLCCLIETRDCIDCIDRIELLFCSNNHFGHLLHRFSVTDSITSKISHAIHGL